MVRLLDPRSHSRQWTPHRRVKEVPLKHADRFGLRGRYDGYALITGGSRGIGRAFAEELAAAGFDLLLVDREAEEGEALASQLRDTYGVDAQLIAYDLERDDLALEAANWAARYEIGIVICNAGISPMGAFFDIPLSSHIATLEINCRSTLVIAHTVGKALVERGGGAIIVVSSASAISGAPYSAHYSATKAYGLNLAASLWSELQDCGVDVLAVCPGLTNTTPVKERGLDRTVPFVVPLGAPGPVARGALQALGRQPVVVPTFTDRVSSSLMARVLPRRWALSLVRRSMEQLQGRKNRKSKGS